MLWSHNDHGDDARIFALSETGEDLGNLKYTVLRAHPVVEVSWKISTAMIIFHPIFAGIWNLKGIVHNDFEDISQGKGPTPGINYIYLGDIGNNHYDREEIFVYRFPEPDISLA